MENEINEAPEVLGLAGFLSGFDLKVSDLVADCGRSRDTLNLWYRKDKKMLSSIIRSCLSKKLEYSYSESCKRLTNDIQKTYEFES